MTVTNWFQWRTPARAARYAFPVICRVSTPDDLGTVALSFRPALSAGRHTRANAGDWAVSGQVHDRLSALSALHCADIQIGYFPFPSDNWPRTNVHADALSLAWFWGHDAGTLDLLVKAGMDTELCAATWARKVGKPALERAA